MNPIAFGGAIWALDLSDLRIVALPFLEAFAIILGGLVAFLASKPLDLNKRAQSMSDLVTEDEGMTERIMNVVTDRFVVTAMASIFGGIALNIMGVPRPGFYPTLNSFLIPLGILLLLSSIGMAMRFGRMGDYLREASVMSLIKFVLVPFSVYILGSFLGLGSVDGGLPLKVSVILASMPVAFTALVPPTLYGLDVDLANTNWYVTTVLLLVVVPVLSVAL